MKLKNISGTPILVPKEGKYVTLEPNSEIVLFDEDVEKNPSILSLIQQGKLLKISDEEPYEAKTKIDIDASVNISKIIRWIRNSDANVSFVQDNRGILTSVVLQNNVPTKLYVGVTDADGTVDIFADDIIITLTPSDGITVNPTSGTISEGKLEVTVTATQEGTITVSNNKNLNNIDLTVLIQG